MEDETRNDEEHAVPIKERHVVMTPTGVTFVLNEEDQLQARKCLERAGKITIRSGSDRVEPE